jgi:hypothetical protein
MRGGDSKMARIMEIFGPSGGKSESFHLIDQFGDVEAVLPASSRQNVNPEKVRNATSRSFVHG